jgi:hypothetical protein
MTGFRPIRSAIIPQKTAEKPLLTMYDAATCENVYITIFVLHDIATSSNSFRA